MFSPPQHQPIRTYREVWKTSEVGFLQKICTFFFRGDPHASSLSLEHEQYWKQYRYKAGAILIVLVAMHVRFCVSCYGYSGQGKPPMFGDYEAQRHWMEITVNTPVREWYLDTPNNDLQYWGLDYPPLSAYFAYVVGRICQSFGDPHLVALFSSRGYETVVTKLFMRQSVAVMDVFLLFPAAFLFMRTYYREYHKHPSYLQMLFFLMFALHPAMILIDHGHFQYNGVCLALLLLALVALIKDRVLIASVLYVCSFCFKQIALYCALPFFFYLLGLALRQRQSHSIIPVVNYVLKLGVTVLLTVAVFFSPWICESVMTASLSPVLHVIHRMFPFARGLFEDKVANFWCASSLAVKWKALLSTTAQVRIALIMTMLASLPSGVNLMMYPTKQRLLYSLSVISLAFFLFSFQVHEKSILFPLLPITCLLLEQPIVVTWFGFIATFSMYPLLKKDGLTIPYYVLQAIWLALSISVNNGRRPTWLSSSSFSAVAQQRRSASAPPGGPEPDWGAGRSVLQTTVSNESGGSARRVGGRSKGQGGVGKFDEGLPEGAPTPLTALKSLAPFSVSSKVVPAIRDPINKLSSVLYTIYQDAYAQGIQKSLFHLSIAGALGIHMFDVAGPVSERYPHIKELLFATFSFCQFAAMYVYLNVVQFTLIL